MGDGTTDFFERQACAQRKTRLLILYFALAILAIVATLHVIFALLFFRPLNDPLVFINVSIGVALVVLIGTAWKIDELSGGGRAVAAMLGGEPVYKNTANVRERRLINVVEEMALASGVPVPDIFLLPDRTINAFAAGHSPGDAVIGVTRGCIEQLSRDELQGVIAHEFSHILHGDMALNIRLMGLLGGILGLSIAGRFLMHGAYIPSRSRGHAGKAIALAVAGGFALYIVGSIGVFFGNLIKAAVSRQREFLADASAVQFTRNPQGIAGALWKIGRFQSRLSSPHAHEASHLFFGNGVADSWIALFATHPPPDDRLKAIDPNFQPPSEVAGVPMVPTETAVGAHGALLEGLPGFAVESVRDVHGACAFVYSFLLDERDNYRNAQLRKSGIQDSLREEALGLFARRGEIAVAQRLPLVDLAVPALRNLSSAQYTAFRNNIRNLVESDGEVHLFEFALQKTLLRHLDVFFFKPPEVATKYHSIVTLRHETCVLLSGLAYVGSEIASERDEAFAAGFRELFVDRRELYDVWSQVYKRMEVCNLLQISWALDKIARAASPVKQTILSACRETVARDDVVAVREYELIRAIADSLDCPLPSM